MESEQITADMFSNYGNGEVFRHQLGLIPEEAEGLTEAFKAKLGFNKSSGVGQGDEEDYDYNNEIGGPGWQNEHETSNDIRFKFETFMAENFNKSVNNDPTKPLTSPLLKHISSEESQLNVVSLNSVVISHAIKTFCKDIYSLKNPNKKQPNILNVVHTNLSTKGTGDSSQKKASKSIFKSNESTNSTKLHTLLATIPSDEFSLMQFIVCYGVFNTKLRNEIYCQLCLQVLKSQSAEGRKHAWVLHMLCAGCFLPTKKIIKYYLTFLNDVKEENDLNYAKHIKKLLQRTNSLGPRHHPPNTLEFKASKVLKKIMLPVLLADGRSFTVQTDSASTASEICFEIANSINLKDQFGFALYISNAEKVSSLGNGSDHIMDAIGECEQNSLTSPWHFFFGKEIFTPWHDAEFDEVSTNLIYCQIIKSVHNKEFKFKSDEDLSRFLSRRCYVELGPTINEKTLTKKLSDYIPRADQSDESKWCKLIMDSFKKMEFNIEKYPRQHVKWSIVEGAQMKWPLQFAALFEAHKVSAKPSLSKNDVVIAISCRGIFLVEEPFKLLCGLHYYEIIEVICEKGAKGQPNQIILLTTSGSKWIFNCDNSETVSKILSSFIDGLRKRSRWAVAIHDFILTDHSKNDKDEFQLKQGDIVELLDESSQSLPDDWMFGRCERTNKINRFPYDCVYIFPSTKRPPNEFLSIFASMSQKDVRTLPRKRAAIVLKKDTIPRSVRQSFI